MAEIRHPKWKDEYKKDVVYLHVLPRTSVRDVVNLSPFAIKLELWLRINNIPFETIDCREFSRKGQSPFILFNGEEIPDTNFIIENLCKYFNKDPYPNLGAAERGIARAFLKMVEENTAWPIFIYRYVENVDEYSEYVFVDRGVEVQKLILGKLHDWVEKRAHGHGIGRHSTDEVQQIGIADVKAISDFLGDKQYMMGDAPTLVDCSVFGVLSQVIDVPMGYPMRTFILHNCPNILNMYNRLKTTYWTNWEEQCKM